MERGAKLRQLRRAKDLTQEYIAFEVGISQKQVSRIENGKVDPRSKLLDAMCAALGITLAELDTLRQDPEDDPGNRP